MPEFKAGRAYIEVAPSLKGFRRKVESDLNTELANAGDKAGERLGSNIGDGAERGASGSGRRSAEKFAGEFDKQVRTRIAAALKALPEAKIDADSSDAERKIQELRVGLVELSDKRIGIDLDATEAHAQIDWIRREMDAIDGDTLKIDARVNTAAAMAELDKLKIEAARVDGDDINIDANVDTAAAHANLSALQAHAAATQGSLASAGGGVSMLALSIAALSPALIPVAAAGVSAMAGIGAAAVGAAAGVGVLAAAIIPVVSAVQALGAADASSARDSAAAAKARQSAADQVKAAHERVSDAVRGVADAEQSAAQRISDAQERVAQVREQGAQRVASAARAVEDAEKRLADAQRASLDAQQAINAAREDARRTLEDLNLDLSGAQIREREAVANLAEAKKMLDRVMANPYASQKDRDQYQLAFDSAKQSLDEIQLRTKRLSVEKAKADKKGVEGSDRVVQAQQRAKDAAAKVKDEERNLADARTAQVKAARDAARENTKAVRDLARAQRDGAKQIAAAQLGVQRAQEALTRAMRDTGDVGSSSMQKVNDAMKNLSPAGKTFALWIYSLKDGLVELSKIAQEGFLPGLMDGLKSMSGYAGLLKDTIGKVATVLGTLAREAGKALTGPFWQNFFKFLAAKAPGWLDTLGRTLGAAATGMAALFQAVSPLIDAMGGGSLSLMERFAAWAKGLGQDKGFQAFLGYVKESGPKVVAFISAFVRAVGNIAVALAPFGTGVLVMLTKALDWIANLDPTQVGAVATAVLAVVGGMKALSVIVPIVNTLMAMGPWGWIAVAVAAVAGAIIYLYQTNSDFKAKIDALWKQIVGIFNGAVAAIQKFWEDHGAQIMAEWDDIWNTISETFSSVWTSIQDIAVSVGGWLQTFWKEWGGRLTDFFSRTWTNVKLVFSGTMQIIRGIFETFAGLFTGNWGRMWNGLKTIFSGAWKVLTGAVQGGIDTLNLLLSLAWAGIKSVGLKAWNGIVDAFGAIWDGIVEKVSGPIDRVMQFIQENLIDKINGLFSFLHIGLHIDPIWKPGNVGTGMANAGKKNPKNQKLFRDGGYTGNKGINQAAGIVHGREFVMDADTTARGGGPRAMEAIRQAIRNGWKPAGYKAGGYVNPVGRAPSFPWGRYPSGGSHPAFDYAVPIGTPVRSPYTGTVIRDGWDTTGYGTSIRGRSDDGIFFVLGHLLREMVNVGQHVVAGQLVGYSGNSGHSSGPHLHFGTSHTPNMIGGAFNPDTGGGGGMLSGLTGFFTNFASNSLAAGIDGLVSSVTQGLSKFQPWGSVLAGVVQTLGTGAENLGMKLLGLDSGGPYPGASDQPRQITPLLFDSGGILPTGISIVKNATGAPEPLMRLNGGDRPASAGDTWHVYGISEDAIHRALRQKEFRDMSRLAI